jgi:hypothetical protein
MLKYRLSRCLLKIVPSSLVREGKGEGGIFGLMTSEVITNANAISKVSL